MAKLCTDEPLDSVTFRCRDCEEVFSCPPKRVEDDPAREYHPWSYYAPCPFCGKECGQVYWEKALMATVGKQTGPKTQEGKLASAQNLDGHPTPEEAQRTRFNAMKGKGFNKALHYYPAKSGAYPMCDTCEYNRNGCEELPACVKNTEVFMRFHMAFESGDHSVLTDLMANSQAALYTIFQNMLMRIIQDGETLEAPKMYYDKDGGCHVFKYTDPSTNEKIVVKEKTAHPLLKHILDFIQKNDMSLGSLDMTPKVQNEQATMKGFLDNATEKREAAEAFNDRMEQGQKRLEQLIKGEDDVISLNPDQVKVVTDG